MNSKWKSISKEIMSNDSSVDLTYIKVDNKELPSPRVSTVTDLNISETENEKNVTSSNIDEKKTSTTSLNGNKTDVNVTGPSELIEKDCQHTDKAKT